MIKQLRHWCLLACFATFTGFFYPAPPSLSAERPPLRQVGLHVGPGYGGKTVALSMGQQLIVTLPLRPHDNNHWYVAYNSGGVLKLIAGPDERRSRKWTPRKYSQEVFYFRRESPGTANLVLDQKYWSKPMILTVVDVSPTPAPPPPPPPPPSPPVKQKLVLRGVHFDFNETSIRRGDAAVLDEAVMTMKENPNAVINVNGYCDSIGSEVYNLRLSEYRGNAVANYLLNSGILATQLRVNGYGKTGFVATNNTAEGRAQNRRVELVPNE